MKRKEQSGLKKITGATGISLMVIGLALATASFAEDVQSLRGATAIDEPNVVGEIPSLDETGRVTKAYRQQPPLIPHRIDKYEVDLKVNQCMRCHDWPNNVAENAPKISETHYRDRDGVALDHVYGGRWFCTQCHVTQTQTRPLVSNTFEPARSSN